MDPIRQMKPTLSLNATLHNMLSGTYCFEAQVEGSRVCQLSSEGVVDAQAMGPTASAGASCIHVMTCCCLLVSFLGLELRYIPMDT
ncbi:hypothetical protein WJX79_009536 [Trebouxia sp. C0005]